MKNNCTLRVNTISEHQNYSDFLYRRGASPGLTTKMHLCNNMALFIIFLYLFILKLYSFMHSVFLYILHLFVHVLLYSFIYKCKDALVIIMDITLQYGDRNSVINQVLYWSTGVISANYVLNVNTYRYHLCKEVLGGTADSGGGRLSGLETT